jgi:AcrR family transcriptional regulator
MAPLPRFHKLCEEKRETILSVAAKEFLDQGFDSASFNRIIEQAGISKGAMYYYFKDKSDLYHTVISGVVDRIVEHTGVTNFEELTADGFWDQMYAIQDRKIGFVVQHPWTIKLWGVGLRLMKSDPTGALATLYNGKMPLMRTWLERGRALGVIWTDAPVELQLQLVLVMGSVVGDWLIEGGPLDEETLRERSRCFLGMMRQALTPPEQITYQGQGMNTQEVSG